MPGQERGVAATEAPVAAEGLRVLNLKEITILVIHGHERIL
jgi:hypothetical protein